MNTTMKFSITGQRIELTEPVMLVAGTVHIYTAAFVFDSAWDGYTKTAVFRSGDVEREQLLTDYACTVPWEVLTAGKYLRVGVYGTKDDIRLPTIWTERTQHINSGAGPTEEAAEPSPTLVEQLLTKVGDLDALKTDDKTSVVAAINEIWASGGGGSGASVTDAAINEDGHLIITLSTGKQIDAGYAVGPAGADGKDGVDGQDGAPGKDGAAGADGQDGVGIQSVTQTTTSTEDGGTNVVTVTKTDGTSSTFTVRNGSRGSTGPAGADGQDGAPGKDGVDGATGPAGADGKSAYQYAQEGGYTGTEAEFTVKLSAKNLELDNTLSAAGKAADAAEVGNQLRALSEDIDNVRDGANWKLLRSIVVPDDPTSDQSGVTWIVNDSGGVTGIEFDTDKSGSNFNCKELSVTARGTCDSAGRLDFYTGSTLLCSFANQQVANLRYSWIRIFRNGPIWQAIGSVAASLRFLHDTQQLYGSGFFGGDESIVDSVADLSLRGTQVYTPGYIFTIWGR